ncbi:NGG1p interacting factor 3 protein, NIF3 [Candidatus Protofrankia datiscae]|uniref:GTP cyclohydrolase 1 type 2 homolog n=1 Tax=Candidatus Protofrankia datiscae TaxID=2716812 RepID=F8AXJ8_9ACTN|nr:NGG1p interacting factor 3 protein, NIF3 [Candidatus Protofrankia datiscae]
MLGAPGSQPGPSGLPADARRQQPSVAECVAELERCYPPSWAQSWDTVGLAVGDPNMPVQHVLFAVDPVVEVVREAVERGAQLLVTHHPLFLRGVHGVAETSAGGRVVATAIRGGVALFTAHTNADVACPGVSDALADALGLTAVEPLDGPPERPEKPAGPPARPGELGALGEEPPPGPVRSGNGGLGRVGELPRAEPLHVFCARVAAALPATAGGVRATGDPDRPVRRIAVCGGSGGELIGAAARAGADALVTADGRHHHVLDAVAAHDVALVDVAHWASEWPWLHIASARLRAGLAARGRTVNTTVSALVTDPWRWHAASPWPAGPDPDRAAGQGYGQRQGQGQVDDRDQGRDQR